MRIPDWSEEAHPQPEALTDAILARRGGQFINLDQVLLWSEPVARGWNVYRKAVRSESFDFPIDCLSTAQTVGLRRSLAA